MLLYLPAPITERRSIWQLASIMRRRMAAIWGSHPPTALSHMRYFTSRLVLLPTVTAAKGILTASPLELKVYSGSSNDESQVTQLIALLKLVA
jgi:hypothetical protein